MFIKKKLCKKLLNMKIKKDCLKYKEQPFKRKNWRKLKTKRPKSNI
jgi:hypothetical protein